MKFILGTKKEMTTVYEGARAIPVTKVSAGPCFITYIKSDDGRDGYSAIQVGYGHKRHQTKSVAGHLAANPDLRFVKEFRVEGAPMEKSTIGKVICADVFSKGEKVTVIGTSKGKGFAGVVKRHGFRGQNKTHGTKDQVRTSGSIGAGGIQHVFKGTRMAGRMGGDRVSVPNLEIVFVDRANNELYIKGAVPGARHSLLMIEGLGDMTLREAAELETQAPVTAVEPAVLLPAEAVTEEAPAEAPAEAATPSPVETPVETA